MSSRRLYGPLGFEVSIVQGKPLFGRTPRVVCLLGALSLFEPAAYAAHPLISEDTGTQGTGNLELELGNSWSVADGGRVYVFKPQLSYGASPTVDLIAQPWWLSTRDATGASNQGFGDTNFDAKWRFFGQDPLSIAVRAGVETPTARDGLGLPQPGYSPHALLVATVDRAPLVLHANLGYVHVPEASGVRVNGYHVSLAAMIAASDRLTITFDAAADSSPDSGVGSRPAVALAGAIYTVRPGLDVDAGYLVGLNSAAVNRQWLLGITFRWAP